MHDLRWRAASGRSILPNERSFISVTQEGNTMGLIGWIVLGAAAGWIASLINKTNNQQGWIGNIVLGIVGALVGGFLWNLIADEDNVIDFSIGSLVIAVVGALIVSFLFSLVTGRRSA
jgi:uncharacterized membrane protein YeaQ/YmgE (transglycosylase-associated protein family)